MTQRLPVRIVLWVLAAAASIGLVVIGIMGMIVKG
jgi:preprotein translocase subunit Sss1